MTRSILPLAAGSLWLFAWSAMAQAETHTPAAAGVWGDGLALEALTSCASECSGHGNCVTVDEEPTCACDSGYYGIGLSCLRDPCEFGGSCSYVDALAGDDGNPGTLAAPWQSIDRVNDAMGGLAAGDNVLFRRGREWPNTVVRIRGVNGLLAEPVTFGAYGEGDRPRVWAIRVEDSTHVTVRDFEQIGSTSGPCTNVTFSSYVILQDMHVHDCSNNGLSFKSAVHHGVMIDNRVWDIPANDALSIHSPSGLTPANAVGDHHWIVDNIVTGTIAEQPVDIATGDDTVPGAEDHKIVGNLLRGGGNGCIALGHGTSVAWVIGNFAAQCTRTETAAAMLLSGSHGALSGSHYRVVGNVIFSNLMPSMQIGGEDPSIPVVFAQHNTFVHNGIGARPAVRSFSNIEISMHHNLIAPTGTQAHVRLESAHDVRAMDDNWYVEAGAGDIAECCGRRHDQAASFASFWV